MRGTHIFFQLQLKIRFKAAAVIFFCGSDIFCFIFFGNTEGEGGSGVWLYLIPFVFQIFFVHFEIQWVACGCIRWQVTHIDHSVRDLGGPLKTCRVLTNTRARDKDWLRKTHEGIFGGSEKHPGSLGTHLWTDQWKIVSTIIWGRWIWGLRRGILRDNIWLSKTSCLHRPVTRMHL